MKSLGGGSTVFPRTGAPESVRSAVGDCGRPSDPPFCGRGY